jgi:4-hydroxy 2-oxovalerate aldolase
MNAPRVLDTSLRDGSHAMSHSFTVEQIGAIAGALDAAGMPAIEVSHGDGLAGGSLQSGFCATPEEELIAAAARVCERARLAVMILPGVGTAGELERALAAGAQIVRVATLCMQADLACRHLELARARGAEAIGFLMMSHLRPPHVLAEQAQLLESHGAECVYLADSAGFMLPDDVRSRVAALKDALAVQVGFHAHNNFGAAIANSIAALEAGADQLDGSLRGLGAGAGNAATELIAAALEHMGVRTGLDTLALLDAAEEIVAPLMPFQPIPDRDSILLGRAGVYSTFLLPARHAAERRGVDSRAIVAELGRRQAVVGQEDLPLDIANELAREAALT